MKTISWKIRNIFECVMKMNRIIQQKQMLAHSEIKYRSLWSMHWKSKEGWLTTF